MMMSSLAASLAFEIGLTSATALSQAGKEVEGKRALLMKMSGRVRKLTMATSESMLLRLRAIAVKTNDSPSPSSREGQEDPEEVDDPEARGKQQAVWDDQCYQEGQDSQEHRLHEVLHDARKEYRGPWYGGGEEGAEEAQLSVEDKVYASESHVEDQDEAYHSGRQVGDVGRRAAECSAAGSIRRVPDGKRLVGLKELPKRTM